MNKNYLRKLGEINLKFYPLGLGTASFAGVNMVGSKNYKPPNDKKIHELINNALMEAEATEVNKLIIDTSAQYGESAMFKKISKHWRNN
jgi:aryl-alcohol dehydrogenase-like predicted oxidoreductase